MMPQKKGVSYLWPLHMLFAVLALAIVFTAFSVIYSVGLGDEGYEFDLVSTSSDLDTDIQLNTLLMSPVSYKDHTLHMRELVKRAALAYKAGEENEATDTFAKVAQKRLNLMEHTYDDIVMGEDRDKLKNCRKKYALTLIEGDATDVDMDRLFTQLTILETVQSRPGHYNTPIQNPYRYYISDKNGGCYKDSKRGFSAARRTISLPDGSVITVQLLSVMDAFGFDN